ncbi:hypothetical protein MASR1M60_22570 [Rhodocyclaceae bacterium]
MLAVAKISGLRLNVSGSLPNIIYRVSEQPSVGDYVQFCSPIPVDALPGGGSCPGGKLPLLKRVVAGAGDHVVVDTEGVTVNGVLLPASAPKQFGRDGTPLPSAVGVWILDSGHIWVAGEHPDSFDSRYFGPVSGV